MEQVEAKSWTRSIRANSILKQTTKYGELALTSSLKSQLIFLQFLLAISYPVNSTITARAKM